MGFLSRTILKEKIWEAMASVLPVSGVVLVLLATFVPVPPDMLLSFLIGAVMLVIGMGLFTLGSETAMTPMGEYVGAKMTSSRKLWLVIAVSFFVGVMITISEPDLTVLASQLESIPSIVLLLAVGLGVGVLLVVAMLRILFKIRLKYLLLFCYAAVFIFAFFVPQSFLAVSFDSGGVTTGPMTVPFIMALGVGVAAIRSDSKEGSDDSFGLIALCSVGPILAVMILGVIFNGQASAGDNYTMPMLDNSRDIFLSFAERLPHDLVEVAIAVGPIVGFFLIFRALSGGIGQKGLGKILIGVLYTYVGLVLFLTGVKVGFMPVGNYLGKAIASSSYAWVIVPLGMLIGYFIVTAEPAVHVLTKQVEEVTSGMIRAKVLSLSLSIGVALSVGLAMLRVLTGIPVLYFLIPGYAIALVLTFFVPDLFTSIAFDSGGVASGPMTATFLLPFAVGACTAVGGNIVEDAFGVVAMVAMTPLIAIQVLGLVYKIKQARSKVEEPMIDENDEMIMTVQEPVIDVVDEDVIDL